MRAPVPPAPVPERREGKAFLSWKGRSLRSLGPGFLRFCAQTAATPSLGRRAIGNKRLQRSQKRLRADDTGILSIQLGQTERVDVLRRPKAPIEVGQVDTGGRVLDEPGPEAQVSGHADRRIDGVVQQDTGNHHLADAKAAQGGLQAGVDEGVVGAFLDHDFAGTRRQQVFEVAARLRGPVGGVRFCGQVLDMKDRSSCSAPGLEQSGRVALGVRVVAALPSGVVDGLLEVDDDEGGVFCDLIGHGCVGLVRLLPGGVGCGRTLAVRPHQHPGEKTGRLLRCGR